jgi:hypothetical protein
LVHYSKLIAGKGVLKVKGPSGLDFPLQTAFWQKILQCGIQQQQLLVYG